MSVFQIQAFAERVIQSVCLKVLLSLIKSVKSMENSYANKDY